MRKTSVYLTEEEAEGLRLLAIREGRPQAELIRAGIRHVIDEAEAGPRSFGAWAPVAAVAGLTSPGHRRTYTPR